MNSIELGKFIANLRNEKHLTQEELADKLYIDKRKISRWECGTSLPEFDMLIKLSEILDVSLYELSICHRIKNDKISRRLLNKFKSIKDVKKYNRKRIVLYLFLSLLMIFFIITTIYTFKFYGTIEVYELVSLDDDYGIEGNYMRINDTHIFNILKINHLNKNHISNNCKYELYDSLYRVFIIPDSNNPYKADYYKRIIINYRIGDKLTIKSYCNNNSNYSFDVKTIKEFDNKLF